MPLNTQQLLAGANYQLNTYAKGDPVDQINFNKPFMKWLMERKNPSVFGNGIFNEKVRISNDSNYQNYTGDQQVTYNRRDTVRLAPFQHYEAHDGFSLNETDLQNNGIIMTDDENAEATEAEKIQIVNLLRENWETLKLGFQENWDLEMHLNGTQNALACPGLDSIVSTTPATGVVGGLDPSVWTFWRNNANMAISTATPGNLIQQMEETHRACTLFGGLVPDAYFCGQAFLDAYRLDAQNTIDRMQIVKGAGVKTDMAAGVETLYFKSVPLVWDPQMDYLDTLLGPITYPWTKRCYFLQSKSLKFRPIKGRWLVNRKPPRMYDRYTHYFGLTADYSLTCNKRNSMAVLSIA
jgi:hypothetical protein